MKKPSLLIAERYQDDPGIRELLPLLTGSGAARINMRGLCGSSRSFVTFALSCLSERSIVLCMQGREEAAYMLNDLETIAGDAHLPAAKRKVHFLPSSFRRDRITDSPDPSMVRMRAEVLEAVLAAQQPLILVSWPEALAEKVVNRNFFQANSLDVSKNMRLSQEFIIETLHTYGFERVDYVVEPGQFAIRGGITDIFSFAADEPCRMEFYGDVIESIRTFNPADQLSVSELDSFRLLPDMNTADASGKATIDEILPEGTFLLTDAYPLFRETLIRYATQADDLRKSASDDLDGSKPDFISPAEALTLGSEYLIADFGAAFPTPDAEISFNTVPQPAFNKNFELLLRALKEAETAEQQCYIFCDSQSQKVRIQQIFEDVSANKPDEKFNVILADDSLHEGFTDSRMKICCFTDHQIFDRYHRFRLRDSYQAKEAITLKEIYNLQPGDYITHIDHGVGRYAGLEKMEVNGRTQEVIRLVYDNNDLLYVSIHSLHRISRYTGKDGTPPRLNRLGSGAWNKLKEKAKAKVKDIAKDLIKLYAERRSSRAHAYPPDTYLQHELEASFIYQDTPDQEKATADIKKDLESDYPMDRLVCGDVGFGKTEVAIRAAFKVVSDSRQVAVLVPTTILALQHYKTFRERLKDMPCRVEYLNRFRSAREQKEVLKELAAGRVDILIGTHRLLGKDIVFSDLGLLVIDEEQKFGVAAKEKLRKLRVNVDTLTLTATPIPRTLQFSLMGARDLSVINTPPPNRYPVQTELHVFREDVISDAINYEISRGGQVFFVHNRVHNIDEVAELVRKLCPAAKVAVAHGQMEGQLLESVMIDFIEGQYDVLVSTTIVESGLDIPNANTIIINEAHHYGLSDLHQLRGRVGRANRKAFCFLLAPPVSMLTDTARRRLKALEQFSGLGSGFNIALRDLDIRGAGNILGADQSGFISEIGFEMYQKILDEALHELKNSDAEITETTRPVWVRECTVETDLELLIPDHYVANISERLALYKELDSTESDAAADEFVIRLRDRFGPLPVQTSELVRTVKLRRMAAAMGIEKLSLRDQTLKAWFVADPQSPFYQSHLFSSVIQYVKENPSYCSFRESGSKLMMVFPETSGVQKALERLLPLFDFLFPASDSGSI